MIGLPSLCDEPRPRVAQSRPCYLPREDPSNCTERRAMKVDGTPKRLLGPFHSEAGDSDGHRVLL